MRAGPLKDAAISLLCRVLRLPFLLSRPRKRVLRALLVVKPCCIGDVLMSTPAVAALRRSYPQARIAYAVGSWSRPTVANDPNVDELIDCASVGSGVRTSPRDYLRLVRELRRRRFDAAAVLDRSPLLALLPFLAGIPVRAGLDSGGRGFSLTHRVPAEPQRHEAGMYLEVASMLGAAPDGGMSLVPNTEQRRWAQDALKALTTERLVALAPGGGVNPGMALALKRWPAAKYADVAVRLARDGASIVIVGDDSDCGAAAEVSEALRRESAPHVSLVGETDLGTLAAVIERGRLLIANDSGPMHIAAAVGTPVVAVFGPTDPELCGPFRARASIVRAGLPCSPCFARGRALPTCAAHDCMAEVSAEQVEAAARALLEGHPSIRAVIFDMDGLMVDSEPLQSRAFKRVLAEYGVTGLDEPIVQVPGVRGRENWEMLKRRFGLSEDTDVLVRKRAQAYRAMLSDNLQPQAGLFEAIDWLRRQGYTLALATSSASSVDIVVHGLGLSAAFAAVVSGNDVSCPKPDPEVFLLAADRLALSPERCLVLEDSGPGVAAARRAGMRCVAVPNEWTRDNDFSSADAVIASLTEFTPELLATL